MRIDYSEPKKAYVSSQGSSRPRKEPAGLFKIMLVVTGVITFVAGFGSGWYFSQKAAKKSFQAATAQNSLESAPKKEAAPPPKPPQPTPPAGAPQPPSESAAPQQPPAGAGAASAPEQPLSFYKSLPSGQKGNVLGSGINIKDDKGKQPLQAPIPSNMAKPVPAEAPKTAPDKPAAKPAENTGFTVQAASYALKSEAETLRNTLAGKGYNAYISESHQGDKGTWYRVRVGRRMEQEAAKELARKLGKSAQVFPDRD